MTTSNRLTALAIKSLKPGFHADGQGLYLRVTTTGKNWSFIFQWEGKRKELGLGPLRNVSLAEARAKAQQARARVRQGTNPILHKNAAGSAPTFGEVAQEFIDIKGSAWRNAKHRQQWSNTLRDYAAPLMSKPVDRITTSDVLACLKPIWSVKPETASRVRQRIENILDAAKARGLRSGENPATWKGMLAHLLPAPSKLSRGHQRAMAWGVAPAFFEALRQRQGVAAKALEFTILTAVRTSETLYAVWSEIDWDNRIWTIPADRTKTATVLRVPLTDDAIGVLREMQALGSNWVFPNNARRGPLSNSAMSAVLKRMGRNVDATVHGFRSTFRDWAGEATEYPREIVELSLGHKVGSAVERAYRRGDALERRRLIMDSWSLYLRK